MKPKTDWWVIFQNEAPHRILAFLEPGTPEEIVRAAAHEIAKAEVHGEVCVGSWPRRNNRYGMRAMVNRAFKEYTTPEAT